jgi:hypothetical protein
MDDAIGYYIMIALLGGAAAYGMANKGKPRPALSKNKKTLATVCFSIALGCGLLLLMLALLPHASSGSIPQ